ncbi:acyl carrier protein [Actinoallomurus vinaceus]|uniref:acyl carrier protein n=1 Tax=Actinoallomurus vinaceus TaxID=1080074 RepID=UPI0031EE619D
MDAPRPVRLATPGGSDGRGRRPEPSTREVLSPAKAADFSDIGSRQASRSVRKSPETTPAEEGHAVDRAKNPDLTAEIKDVVIGVLELGIDRAQLHETVSLYSPMVGLDSLSLLHILVQIEKRCDIEIDDEDVMAAELSDVGSLVRLIRGIVDAKGADE